MNENTTEFEEIFENPLHIKCSACGAPAHYDIIRQNYGCVHCGATTDLQAPVLAMQKYRQKQAEKLKAGKQKDKFKKHNCPNCGAVVVMDAGEATGKCDFCGTKTVNSEFVDSDSFPELIIPFKLTLDEAKAELEKWIAANKNTAEAKLLADRLDELKGYYLPYQVVKGAVTGEVSRARAFRYYSYGGFIEEVAVNTSRQLDNLLLDAAEPFDWREVRPFEYGYIAGQHTKLEDSTDEAISARINQEIRETYLPTIEKALMSQDLDNSIHTENVLKSPALMPLYIINSGIVKCVVNGQTGRVAVTPLKETVTQYAWLEPVLITLFIFGLSSILPIFLGYHASLEISGMLAVIVGLIVWTAYEKTKTVKKKIYLHSPKQLAKREHTKLVFTDASELSDNPALKPVFFEDLGAGIEAVNISFYTPDRIVKGLAFAVGLIFLPNIIAGLTALSKGQGFFEPNHVYAAAWWTLAVPVTFVLYLAIGRRDIFDSPVYYRIKPDGGTERVKTASGDSLPIFEMLSELRKEKIGWMVIAFLAFMLIGSLGAILD